MNSVNNSLKKKNRMVTVATIFAVAIFCIITFVVGIMVQNFSKKSTEMERISIQRSISQATALCYAVEGVYPPSLQYLQDNYNIYIDTNNYIVHYEVFASNIFPEILVFSITTE